MPALVSVLGRDAAGDYLLAHWAATGSLVEHILRVDDPTPTLCAIIDRGDLCEDCSCWHCRMLHSICLSMTFLSASMLTN